MRGGHPYPVPSAHAHLLLSGSDCPLTLNYLYQVFSLIIFLAFFNVY